MQELNVLRDRFQSIYKNNTWNGGSGPGSSPSSTIEYRAFLERFIFENNIKSVTDLGCGDWQFSRFINWSNVTYTGVDVVPELVAANNSNFAAPNISFRTLENPNSLPGGDLLIAKEVLQHLPNDMITAYITHISRIYKFSLITNSVPLSDANNHEIELGGFRPLRIQAPPFNARGAVIFVYYPRNKHKIWYNTVFLMFGHD